MIGRADPVAVSALLLLAFATLGRGAEPESAAPESRPVIWALDSGFCEPETVVWSESRRQMHVSNICGFAADGTIVAFELPD